MNKYKNKPTYVNKIRFASKAEAARFVQLKLLEKNKTISKLRLQPRYPLFVNGVLICTYIADFEFVVRGVDAIIVEDVKGKEIQPFPIKAKLFKVLYPGHKLFLVKNGKVVPY